jgi:hypothetical protein
MISSPKKKKREIIQISFLWQKKKSVRYKMPRETGAATFDPARKAHLIFFLSTRPKPNRKGEQTTGRGKGRERSTPRRHSSLPPTAPPLPGIMECRILGSHCAGGKILGKTGSTTWVPLGSLFVSVSYRIFHLILSLALAISSFDLV